MLALEIGMRCQRLAQQGIIARRVGQRFGNRIDHVAPGQQARRPDGCCLPVDRDVDHRHRSGQREVNDVSGSTGTIAFAAVPDRNQDIGRGDNGLADQHIGAFGIRAITGQREILARGFELAAEFVAFDPFSEILAIFFRAERQQCPNMKSAIARDGCRELVGASRERGVEAKQGRSGIEDHLLGIVESHRGLSQLGKYGGDHGLQGCDGARGKDYRAMTGDCDVERQAGTRRMLNRQHYLVNRG